MEKNTIREQLSFCLYGSSKMRSKSLDLIEWTLKENGIDITNDQPSASQEATTSESALPISDVVQQRELLLGLLRFERKNGFETTTLVNEGIVDQYLDEL